MNGTDFQADDTITIVADDSRLQTQVGLRADGRISSTKSAGMLLFGPYVELAPGSYEVAIQGTFEGHGGRAEVEITSDCGEYSLASRQVRRQESPEAITTARFATDKPCKYVEIRVFIDGTADISISRITIAKGKYEKPVIGTRRRIFDNGETVADLTTIGSDRLVITFQPYGFAGTDRRGFGEDFIPTLGCDVLCFKPKRNNWYQDIAFEDLKHEIAPKIAHYRNRIGYGSSMGAYALFYFATALRIQEIVALSPQYTVDPSIAPFEDRWVETKSINFHHYWQEDSKIMAFVFYDPHDKSDKWHVEKIREMFPHGRDFLLPFSGHPTTTALAECRQLKVFVEDFLKNKLAAPRELREKIRESCAFTYASLLIARAARRDGFMSIRLFLFFATRHAGNAKWLLDTTIFTGDKFKAAGRVFHAYLLAAAYAIAKNPDFDRSRINDVRYIEAQLPEKLREHFNDWIADWRPTFPMPHVKILTKVGESADNVMRSTGAPGILLYGPYATLPAGKFVVRVTGSSQGPAGGLVRIMTNYAKRELARHDIAPNQGDFSIELACQSTEECVATEVIVDVAEGADVTIKQLDIQVTEIQPNTIGLNTSLLM